jgi:hypothetical protein
MNFVPVVLELRCEHATQVFLVIGYEDLFHLTHGRAV